MSAKIYYCFGRYEMSTTHLGAAVFDGLNEKIEAAFRSGIDWNEEGVHPLIAAIYTKNRPLFQRFLSEGAPVSDELYGAIYYYGDHLFFEDLPHRPDLLDPLKESTQCHRLALAILDDDFALFLSLLNKDRLESQTHILAGQVTMRPLHHAARKGNLEMIKALVDAGADVNSLDGEGKSVLRWVAESFQFTIRDRKEAIRYLRKRGAKFAPEIEGFWNKFWLYRGHRYDRN